MEPLRVPNNQVGHSIYYARAQILISPQGHGGITVSSISQDESHPREAVSQAPKVIERRKSMLLTPEATPRNRYTAPYSASDSSKPSPLSPSSPTPTRDKPTYDKPYVSVRSRPSTRHPVPSRSRQLPQVQSSTSSDGHWFPDSKPDICIGTGISGAESLEVDRNSVSSYAAQQRETLNSILRDPGQFPGIYETDGGTTAENAHDNENECEDDGDPLLPLSSVVSSGRRPTASAMVTRNDHFPRCRLWCLLVGHTTTATAMVPARDRFPPCRCQ
jgi:hypothetical protein